MKKNEKTTERPVFWEEHSLNEYGQYILIAYKYGHRECHSYIFDLVSDIDTAKQLAQKEADERGGRYSVIVLAKRKVGHIEEIYTAHCSNLYHVELTGLGKKLEESEKRVEELKERLSRYEKEHGKYL